MSEQDPGAAVGFEAESVRLKRIAMAILGDEARADDVLQEVWLMTHACKPGDFEDERAWLAGVVRNLSRNVLRSEQRARRRERRAARAERLESTSDVVSRTSVIEYLRRAIVQLPELERIPLELRYMEGLELREVSARLGRPVATVKHQLRRGLQALRRSMSTEFGDSRAWSLGLIAAFDWEPAEVRAALSTAGTGVSAAVIWTWSAAVMAGVIGLVLWLGGDSTAERAREIARSPPGSSSDERALRTPDDPTRRATGADDPSVAAGTLPAGGTQRPAGPSDAEPPVAAQPSWSLDVLVVDALGLPVAGADVILAQASPGMLAGESREGRTLDWDPDRVRARTDAGGRARIPLESDDVLPDRGFGDYCQLIARAGGFAHSDSHSVPLPDAGTREVRVVLADPEVVLEGRALDAQGRPISDGKVVLQSVSRPSRRWSEGVLLVPAETRSQGLLADGAYRIDHIRPGVYQLFVLDRRAGMDQTTVDLTVPGLHVQDVVQADGVLLRGRVLDSEGVPVEGAEVWFEYASATQFEQPPIAPVRTDAQGAFELPGLSNTTTRFYARSLAEDDLRCMLETVVQPERGAGIELVLERRAAVVLEVRDRKGVPLPNIMVMIQRTFPASAHVESEGVTDGEGRVRLSVRRTEDGALDVALCDVSKHYSLPEQFQRLPPSTGGPIPITFDPQAPGSIVGTVTVEGWERPYGLRLSLLCRRSLVAATFPLPDEAGPFSVESLPPGPYLLSIEGRQALIEPLAAVEVRPGAALDLGSVRLPQPGTAAFDWRFEGAPSESAPTRFSVVRTGTHSAAWVSDRPLEEPLELLPGSYVLTVLRSDGTELERAFTIESGAESWVVVE